MMFVDRGGCRDAACWICGHDVGSPPTITQIEEGMQPWAGGHSEFVTSRMRTIVNVLRTARQYKRLTQEQLAAKISKSPRTISAWEVMRRADGIRLLDLLRMLEILNLDIEIVSRKKGS